jgi:hypothetical protein
VSISLIGPVKAKAFRELLDVMLGRARLVGLVAPVTESIDDTGAQLLSALSAESVAQEKSRTWPGVLVPEWAKPSIVHTFRYTPAVADNLYAYCQDLFGWQRLGLSGDLHFLGADGEVLLGSLTAESDAWLEWSVDAWQAVVSGTEKLRSIPVRQDL